jgi:hypothetical protein
MVAVAVSADTHTFTIGTRVSRAAVPQHCFCVLSLHSRSTMRSCWTLDIASTMRRIPDVGICLTSSERDPPN